MRVMFLLFNHSLTDEQTQDAKDSFKIESFVSLPQNLQSIWSNIPPELENLTEYLQPIKEFIAQNAQKGDYILIQGDFGASFQLVEFANSCELISVYATTKREVKEELKDGKVQKTSVFKHVQFRKYT